MRKILTIVVIVSQSLPNQVNDFNTALGPWSAGVIKIVAIPSKPGQRLQSSEEGVVTVVLVGCRNPFQTRSTTSIRPYGPRAVVGRGVAIPSKPGQRLQCSTGFGLRSESRMCRNPFQTRSTTSIWWEGRPSPIQKKSRNPFQTRSTTSISPIGR